ncbi:hypothetical protein CIG19_18785 [Enterobacterales bacterium CwR94]|nr:hypothetical protein CIG19_18785 [Enterobacterales bacterium CwR94]
MAQHEMADLSDPLVLASVKVDDGCDHKYCIVWDMNARRRMRNGTNEPRPKPVQVAPVKIEPKKKPRKRSYKTVQQDIGAV